jgi:hypothetical protein
LLQERIAALSLICNGTNSTLHTPQQMCNTQINICAMSWEASDTLCKRFSDQTMCAMASCVAARMPPCLKTARP